MDYAMAMNYIEEKNKLGSVPGLANIKELLRRMGNPQSRCRCLHIAGTNGKGSVFSYVQEILLQAGYRVGRYISPTVFCYLERFQINRRNISRGRFAGLLTQVAEQVEGMMRDGFESPTAFEIETALAYLYFAEEQVDFALIECGMGGDLDATNVLEHAEISVLTSVSRDHMQFLGEAEEEIASHKAGIIKAHSVCVSAPQSKAVTEVIAARCRDMQTAFVQVEEREIEVYRMDVNGTSFSYKGESYEIGMLGEHQVVNAVTAVCAAKLLPGVTGNHIRQGLKNTVWAGRMTKVCDNPLMYVDGAHNEAAWKYLKKTVNKYFTNRKIIYIIGVLRDKEYRKMVDILADTMSCAVTVTPDTPRGLNRAVLADLISEKGVPAYEADSPADAIGRAVRESGRMGTAEETMILVCGSLSFIADYLNYRPKEEV